MTEATPTAVPETARTVRTLWARTALSAAEAGFASTSTTRQALFTDDASEELVRKEISRNHVRHDAFEVLDRTPSLAARAA